MPEKETKPIGPWSYTPKDDLCKHKATNGLIHPANALPSVVPTGNEDLKLRQLAEQYLSAQKKSPAILVSAGGSNVNKDH